MPRDARLLAAQGALLVAGTVDGELLRIIPQSGATASLGKLGKGAISAIAVRGTSTWFATDGNEVWDLTNLTAPLYKMLAHRGVRAEGAGERARRRMERRPRRARKARR